MFRRPDDYVPDPSEHAYPDRFRLYLAARRRARLLPPPTAPANPDVTWEQEPLREIPADLREPYVIDAEWRAEQDAARRSSGPVAALEGPPVDNPPRLAGSGDWKRILRAIFSRRVKEDRARKAYDPSMVLVLIIVLLALVVLVVPLAKGTFKGRTRADLVGSVWRGQVTMG